MSLTKTSLIRHHSPIRVGEKVALSKEKKKEREGREGKKERMKKRERKGEGERGREEGRKGGKKKEVMLTRSLLQKKVITWKIKRNWYADAKGLKVEGLSMDAAQ